MLALSIRQPYAELILRGIKSIEYRSKPTKIIGKRFWIYAAKTPVPMPKAQTSGRVVSSDNLSADAPPPWLIELAEAMRIFGTSTMDELPRGLIVGTAVVEKVVKREFHLVGGAVLASSNSGSTEIPEPMTIYQWHLGAIERLAVPMKPARHPQPIWFRPFEN